MRGLVVVAAVLGGCNATPAARSAPPPAGLAATAVASAAPEPIEPGSSDVVSAAAGAQRVAELWLAGVDAGKYAESWTEAATLFRAAVDRGGFVKAMTESRAPLGALRSRALRSARYATSLPGAPDGQYVVVQFDTAFDNEPQALETVTPMKDADGQWRVSGYFIK
jgi:hypothetical protein